MLGEELHAPDVLVHLGDMRLALNERAVLHDRIEPHVRRRCWKHAPLDSENLRRLLQRLLHITRNLRHGSDEEIAEAVSFEFRAALKAILEELFHQRLRIGERDETVPEIARRDDAEFLSQPSRRAAVVGNRHDRRHIARRLLDAAKEHGKPVPAADHCDLRPFVEATLLVDDVDKLFRVVGQEHADDGTYDEARRKEHEGESQDDNDKTDDRRDHIIETSAPQVDGAEDGLLNDIEILVVEDEGKPQTDHHDTRAEHEHPTLEMHARIKPFQ